MEEYLMIILGRFSPVLQEMLWARRGGGGGGCGGEVIGTH